MKYENLLGRQFVHGITDCYSIIKDFYKQNYDINLTDYARPDDWWNNGENLYLDNAEKEGFTVFSYDFKLLEDGNVLLFQIKSPVPNHAAIILGTKLLHHLPKRLSCLDSFNGIWRSCCTHILKHPVTTTYNSPGVQDLIDHLPLAKRVQYGVSL